ncbi:MAG: YlxM family DNA-binding protein [Firmicutes bacterium]|nr:YlxM family DNA-binding protein [Bacillota bacterium]
MTLLYDFYGELLTRHQRELVRLYYGEGLSLGEIARDFGISRQAVYDALRRAEETLCGYEEKLGLVARHLRERERLGEALRLLDECGADSRPALLRRVRSLLHEVLQEA